MFTRKILQSLTFMSSRRLISGTAKKFEAKPPTTNANPSSDPSILGPKMIGPSGFDQWLLTWVKKYPKGKVPSRVTLEVMQQARSKARIKATNYMIVFSIIGSLISVYLGKKAQKEGDSIQKRNLDWHAKLKEEYEAEMKARS